MKKNMIGGNPRHWIKPNRTRGDQRDAYLCCVGGRTHTPELQVGQLSTEEVPAAPELGVKKEDSSFWGLGTWHLGQFKREPSFPKDWRTSNFSPHCMHRYSRRQRGSANVLPNNPDMRLQLAWPGEYPLTV